MVQSVEQILNTKNTANTSAVSTNPVATIGATTLKSNPVTDENSLVSFSDDSSQNINTETKATSIQNLLLQSYQNMIDAKEMELQSARKRLNYTKDKDEIKSIKSKINSINTEINSLMDKMMSSMLEMNLSALSTYSNTDVSQNLDAISGTIPANASGYLKLGYNAQKGTQLAKAASNPIGGTGYCYRGVINSLAKVGITGLTGGSAYMAADQLAARKDFKEVPKGSLSASDLKNLPAGAIVVWDKKGNKIHGHISISLGDGRESSDHIATQYTNIGYTDFRVFLPV